MPVRQPVLERERERQRDAERERENRQTDRQRKEKMLGETENTYLYFVPVRTWDSGLQR